MIEWGGKKISRRQGGCSANGPAGLWQNHCEIKPDFNARRPEAAKK
jgi:hypothetical protein